ncbi:hypothetical protein NDU88_005613 [Pleurodeles waltl]|uniref:Uncharacterized protein n=1 Tax=Pleurodeles waltl TaxID=8319 RepID=A0AAV7VM43_PLEWA|nr:hypothetical protein NDU88_005613 [Pleurodeles waltl]
MQTLECIKADSTADAESSVPVNGRASISSLQAVHWRHKPSNEAGTNNIEEMPAKGGRRSENQPSPETVINAVRRLATGLT